MTIKKTGRSLLALVASALVGWVLNLVAQSAPTIATQPSSQAAMPGSNVTFRVEVDGDGPFVYQWQFNGTALPNIVSTVAGNGTFGYSGDDGTATNASLSMPNAVALDAAGNLYVADTSNHRIRKVDTNGSITTVAGTGNADYTGDGGAAINASLNRPRGLALDAAGNLYIADQSNYRVRKVDLAGIITTVAGNGSGTDAGDGGAATNASLDVPYAVALDASENLYIAGATRVRKVDSHGIITTVAGNGNVYYSGDGVAATNSSLYHPQDLTSDGAGNLYIADTYNARIRKVGTNGIITTVAGGGSGTFGGDGGAATNASLNAPYSVTLDGVGSLYIADQSNHRIRKVDPKGVITTVAGNGIGNYEGDGGVATDAGFYDPQGLALDGAGNLYVADTQNQRIRKIHFEAEPAFTLTNAAPMNVGNYAVVVTSPYGSVTSAVATLTVEAPAVITVQPASQMAMLGSSPMMSLAAVGSGPFGYLWYFAGASLVQSGTNNTLTLPGFSVDQAGNYTVVVTNAYGSVTSRVATLTAALPPFLTAQPASLAVSPGDNVRFSVAVDGTGPFIYQWQVNGTNLPNNIISTFAGVGATGYTADGVPATTTGLNAPSGVALDAAGNLCIADSNNNRVRKVDTNGIINGVAGTGGFGYSGDGGAAINANLYSPRGVVFDAAGNLYIADYYNHRIRKVDANGIITTVAGKSGAGYSGDGGAATNANLNSPSGLALDAAGNLYIADANNHRIRKVDVNGIITTVAGKSVAGYSGDGGAAINANLNSPSGVALDLVGNLYIADASNHRIRMVDFNGIITTIAGNGSGSYGGDGGAATNASLYAASGVALDGAGSLYIADSSNNRIRKVDARGTISTVAGNGSGSYGGDGRTATNASLSSPRGLTLDGAGNLYIADVNNARIRKVHLPVEPRLTLTNVGPVNAGSYAVVVTGPYGAVTSAVATLTVEGPAAITVQPASQIALVGSSPLLSVTVAGSGPFGYSWYLAATNLVQSGTNTTLTLTGFAASQAGNYTVVVTNAYGSVTSQVATLTAAFPPSLITQPAGQTALPGGTASFNVALDGSGPFTYQWQFNGINLPNNALFTVAGKGTATYAGDGGRATYASLYSPRAVALDGVGNLYIADMANHRIRKVDTNGFITTVAGKGSGAYLGDGGAATNACVYNPSGLALDSAGNLYIADTSNARVRKVDRNGIITTVAGKGSAGYAGDGGSATNASLSNPASVALDAVGNLYIADTSNARVRKVDRNGIITTVAGKGLFSYSGDGGAATNAGVNLPTGVALDDLGNLYIADTSNNRIRKVDTNGIITTVAGNGSPGYSGDGGAATNARVYNPKGVVCYGHGNLYISDSLNNCIRKVETNGIITTVAANGLSSPFGVALDASGNLYIADTSNNRVRKFLLYAGYPTLTLSSVGAVNAGDYTVVISSPYGSVTSAVATLAVEAPPLITSQPISRTTGVGASPMFSVAIAGSGPLGYLWFHNGTNLLQNGASSTLMLPAVSTDDAGDYTVVVTNTYGSVTSQVACLTVALPPLVTSQPAGQTVGCGTNVSLSVAVTGIGPFSYQWQLNGTNLPNNLITTVAGNGIYTFGGDGTAATNASLAGPQGLGFDNSGNLYIADNDNNRVRKVNASGIITTVAGNGNAKYAGDGGAATNASMYHPNNVVFAADGSWYIADVLNSCIRKVDTNGFISTVAGKGGSTGFSGDGGSASDAALYYPVGVALDGTAQRWYIADMFNHRIRKVDSYGIISTVAGNGSASYAGDGGAATNVSVNRPECVTLDALGNLYIADCNNNRIRKIDTNGTISTVAGNGTGGYSGDGGAATNASLYKPWFVALDGLGGFYIADCSNNRIRRVDTNGIITTVAGNGNPAFAGDGGAATNASLDAPACVALDGGGNLYIADWGNNRIREVHLAGDPTYALTNVSFNNAGDYTVVVSSPYGSVTSTVATLTVTVPRTPPLLITSDASFGLMTNRFGFMVGGAVGQTIVVDGSTDLRNWAPLYTNVAGTGLFYFFDAGWTNFPSRFYRARLP